MTHITPQQAREMAGLALDHGTTARALNSLADQVDAAVNAGHIAVEMCGKLIAERYALTDQLIGCSARGYQQAIEHASAAVLALKIPLAAKAECELAIERLMK